VTGDWFTFKVKKWGGGRLICGTCIVGGIFLKKKLGRIWGGCSQRNSETQGIAMSGLWGLRTISNPLKPLQPAVELLKPGQSGVLRKTKLVRGRLPGGRHFFLGVQFTPGNLPIVPG